MTGYAAGRSLEKVRGRHKVIPYLPPAPPRDRRVWRSWEGLLSGLAAKLFVIAVVVGPVARFHHRAVLGLLALSLLQVPGADKAQGRQEDGKDRGDAGALAHWVALRKARAGLLEGRWLLASRLGFLRVHRQCAHLSIEQQGLPSYCLAPCSAGHRDSRLLAFCAKG